MTTPQIPQNEKAESCAVVTAEMPDIMTVEELALLLRVNRKTLYEAVSKHQIPGVRRVGRIIRISRQAVLKWLHG